MYNQDIISEASGISLTMQVTYVCAAAIVEVGGGVGGRIQKHLSSWQWQGIS